MPESNQLSEGEIESLLDEKVRTALDAKIAEYRRIVYAFFGGLALFVTFLVGNHLVSSKSLLVMVHDAAFDSRRHLDDALRDSVAVSYSNHFWLSQSDDNYEQAISFYAADSQSVAASIEIKHYGAGEPVGVAAHLDNVRIFETDEDISEQLVLDEHLKEALQRPNNVRRLIFRIDDAEQAARDRVLVRVLINVKGLEERTP